MEKLLVATLSGSPKKTNTVATRGARRPAIVPTLRSQQAHILRMQQSRNLAASTPSSARSSTTSLTSRSYALPTTVKDLKRAQQQRTTTRTTTTSTTTSTAAATTRPATATVRARPTPAPSVTSRTVQRPATAYPTLTSELAKKAERLGIVRRPVTAGPRTTSRLAPPTQTATRASSEPVTMTMRRTLREAYSRRTNPRPTYTLSTDGMVHTHASGRACLACQRKQREAEELHRDIAEELGAPAEETPQIEQDIVDSPRVSRSEVTAPYNDHITETRRDSVLSGMYLTFLVIVFIMKNYDL